ncbi:MAG: YgiQ family radical SAM protein, partial [Victivallales bacterium]|nr:YgiQ family radical SAM protein [Victivallales bacterium]
MSHVQPEFIPLTIAETRKLGWDEIDILLITGDVYVDHPSYGAAIIGRLLLDAGYRVAMIAQPDWKDPESLKTFGRPRIACAITSGNMDSMVNIYTAGRRFRREDAYSINGETGKRPPHALTVYTQLAKQAFPKIPVQVGGLEASLRRVAHYDYWQDKIRPGVLVDSKADILVFGQGEKPVLEIYRRLAVGQSLEGIRGTARLLGKNAAEVFDSSDYVEIPSYEEHLNNRDALMASTVIVEREMNPWCGKGLIQRYDQRLLVIEPSPEPMSTEESDHVHSLPFKYLPHPIYKGQNIPAFETIKNSIPAVRGCPGGCAFCGLVSHQGRHMTFRSEESIVNEVERLKKLAHFRGTISDIGGPAGNIYGNVPFEPEKCHSCKRSSCLYPKVCKNYNADGTRLIKLLRRVRSIDGVKHLHINSGVRLELALLHKELSRELIHHHVSGHLKVAPEHLHSNVTALMRKDPPESFFKFKKIFEEESASAGKEQYLIP